MMNAMMGLEMKKNIQDRGMLFWTILLPIAFTVLGISVFAPGGDEVTEQEVILSIVPGYTVMFVFFIMISMVSAFLKDRDHGMIARIASTPLPPHLYLLGKWLPYMFIVWIQIIILLSFGKIVYNLPIEQPLMLFPLSISLAFAATGIGLVLAMCVKTENMGIALTQVIALGGAMFGGLWMPLEFLPDIMQSVARLTPQYWAHQSFQDALNGTLAFKDFFQSFMMVTLFGFLGLVIAILRYPYFLKQARG